MQQRMFIGLDVHARSVKAGLLDGETGEVSVRSAPTRTEALVAWICKLPAPAAVAYEAGPTGFGLARALKEAGVSCLVAAPSRIERAPGDRVKTDRRDALRLARLLCLGELAPVRVPNREEEAAAISCVPARTPAPTSCAPATGSPSCCCVRACSGTARLGRRPTVSGSPASASRRAPC